MKVRWEVLELLHGKTDMHMLPFFSLYHWVSGTNIVILIGTSDLGIRDAENLSLFVDTGVALYFHPGVYCGDSLILWSNTMQLVSNRNPTNQES
jgi:hypothetical protein